jgi:hypothetical protein
MVLNRFEEDSGFELGAFTHKQSNIPMSDLKRALTIFFHLTFGVLLFLLGTILLCMAVPQYKKGREFLKNGISVSGTVLEYSNNPWIKFLTSQGEIRTIISTSRHKPNEKIKIFYDPKNPKNAIEDEPFNRWLEAYAFITFGPPTFLSGVFLLRNFKNNIRKRPKDE